MTVVSRPRKSQRLFCCTYRTIDLPLCSRLAAFPRSTQVRDNSLSCLAGILKPLVHLGIMGCHLLSGRILCLVAWQFAWTEARASVKESFAFIASQFLEHYASFAGRFCVHPSVMFAPWFTHRYLRVGLKIGNPASYRQRTHSA